MATPALQVGPSDAAADAPFGVNEVRLNPKQWLAAAAVVLTFVTLMPSLWKRVETFPTGPDYRIPYAISKDYWLYQRRLENLSDLRRIPILGDSVVWGEYVKPDGTLSHFLNEQSGVGDKFVNCGVNGLFPLALEGLISDYGASLRNRRIIVQCNLLWLTSPKADLSTAKEENFNHSRLVPQFGVRIPCYRATASERLSAVLERKLGFFAWTAHLQTAYYDQRSPSQWTLEDDGGDPPVYQNAWRVPWSPLFAGIPSEAKVDPQRGPSSVRHKPWSSGGAAPTHFEWVALSRSLQWSAFQRTLHLLRERGNSVLVMLGPFNEHMIADGQRAEYRALRDGAAAELSRDDGFLVAPDTLPSELYADASHPLTTGYSKLAAQLFANERFRRWAEQR